MREGAALASVHAEFPTVVGTVDVWHAEEGWGVLRTPDGLTVFCHFSHVDLPGYKSLIPDQSVEFDSRTPGQDGFDASVSTFARPAPEAAPARGNRDQAALPSGAKKTRRYRPAPRRRGATVRRQEDAAFSAL